jgi:hypothetical protein
VKFFKILLLWLATAAAFAAEAPATPSAPITSQ